MKRALLSFLVLATITARAELIDRMVAVVNRHVITLSDVRVERQLRLVFGDNAPVDDKAIVRDLVDRQIIDDQVAQFPGIEIDDQQIQEQMNRLTDLLGLRPELVREAIARRLRATDFFEKRFRQFLQATDDEIRQYYETKFVPEATSRGLNPIPPVEAVTAQIRNNIIQEKLMRDVDNWLEASRRRSDIEIFD